MSEMLQKLEAVYKAAATDFKLNGVLTDQQTEAWFTNVFDKGQFINRVSRRLRNKLTGSTGFIEGNNEALVRAVEGVEAANIDAHSQRFSTYFLLNFMLPAMVGYGVIDDNPEHGLLAKINAVLDQNVANSLQNVAINGTLDDYSGGFFTLNKGWIQLGKDSATIKKIPLAVDDPYFEDLDGLCTDMRLELAQEHRMDLVFICSDSERLRRNKRIAQNSSSVAEAVALAAMTDEMKMTIGDTPVVNPFFWPDGVYMLTDPENLEIDIHRTVRRAIEEKVRKTCFEYTYFGLFDAEIVEHKKSCIAY